MTDNITVLFCPDCGKMIMNDCDPRLDDVGTKWYKCDHCQKETSNPKRKIISALKGSYDTFDNTEKFNPNRFAKQLMDNFFFKTDKKTELMYVYDNCREYGILKVKFLFIKP